MANVLPAMSYAVGACTCTWVEYLPCVQKVDMACVVVRCSSLEAEDKQLSSKVPLPVNRLCRVRQWLGERNAELANEQAALEGKQMVGCDRFDLRGPP